MITLIDIDCYELKAEIDGTVVYLHMEYKFNKFTKSIYQELLIQWESILNNLKENGIKVVATLIPNDWDKVKKWQTMFGLVPTHIIGDKLLFRREL